MFRALLASLAIAAIAVALPSIETPTQPHLAQAWTAMSTGDGLPGQIGLESYIYQKGKENDGSMRAHKWDYGASCIKYEVDGGFAYPGTGQYYVNCDAVDCCKDDGPDDDVPDVKMWDIPKASWWKSTQVGFAGIKDITALNNETVKHAEEWWSNSAIPFTKVGVNYTYFLTRNTAGNSTDIITHRIDYTAGPTVTPGSILYGNFTVQKDLEAFKKTFMPPPECLKPNTLSCQSKQVKKWNRKYFKHAAAQRGWF